MKNKKTKKDRLEDLIPDPEKRKEVLGRMYKGEPIFGECGIFTDMLQAFVNEDLKGEADEHIAQSIGDKISNPRNAYNSIKVKSSSGELEINTLRDCAGSCGPRFVGKWDCRRITSMGLNSGRFKATWSY